MLVFIEGDVFKWLMDQLQIARALGQGQGEGSGKADLIPDYWRQVNPRGNDHRCLVLAGLFRLHIVGSMQSGEKV